MVDRSSTDTSVAQDARDRGELRTLIIAAIDRNLGDGIPGTKEAADAILSLDTE